MNKRVLASQPLLCNCWLCHIMISKDNCSWPLKLLQNFNKWNSLTYWFLYGLYILCTDITFINSNSLYDQTVHFTCDFIPRHHKTVGFLYPSCQQFLKDKSLSQLVKHYFLCTVAMNTFLCNKTHHIQDQVSMFDKHSLALNMSDRLLSF